MPPKESRAQNIAKQYDVPVAAVKTVLEVFSENQAAIDVSWGKEEQLKTTWAADQMIKPKDEQQSWEEFQEFAASPEGKIELTMRYIQDSELLDEMREFPAKEAFEAFTRRYTGVKSDPELTHSLIDTFVKNAGGEEMVSRWPRLQPGERGESVQHIQRALGIKPSGDFDPMTEQAVKDFQRSVGLEADGQVTAKVWKALGFPD